MRAFQYVKNLFPEQGKDGISAAETVGNVFQPPAQGLALCVGGQAVFAFAAGKVHAGARAFLPHIKFDGPDLHRLALHKGVGKAERVEVDAPRLSVHFRLVLAVAV